MQVHRAFAGQDDQGIMDQSSDAAEIHLLGSRALKFREDWLLPKVEIPFTEPDMYENVLNSSWANYIFTLAPPDPSGAVKDVNSEDYISTISMSDILPEIRLSDRMKKEVPLTPDSTHDTVNGINCSHCGTEKTSLWRRREGRLVCNACALYEKLHGIPRPAHLLNQILRRRNRSDSVRRRKRN